MKSFLLACVVFVWSLAAPLAVGVEPPIKVLFLGDSGHHQPAERFAQLEPVLESRGIELVYTDRLADLDPKALSAYDALVVYANIDTLPPAGEAAILALTKRINGGTHGLDDRRLKTKKYAVWL